LISNEGAAVIGRLASREPELGAVIQTGETMKENSRIDLAIESIERRRDRLQKRADNLEFGSILGAEMRSAERGKALAGVEALEWAVVILGEGEKTAGGGDGTKTDG